MRRKPLWVATLASGLCMAVGAFLYRVLLGPRPVVRIATDTGAILAEIRQWFRLAVAHSSRRTSWKEWAWRGLSSF